MDNKLNILFVGEMGNAVNNLLLFYKMNYNVIVLNTSIISFWDDVPGFKGKNCNYDVINLYKYKKSSNFRFIKKYILLLRRALRPLFFQYLRFLVVEKKELDTFIDIKNKYKIDLIFASWGVSVVSDIFLIKEQFKYIPIIHNLPTFPTSEVSWFREKIELFNFQKALSLIDGLLISNIDMCLYLSNKYFLGEKKYLIGPFSYCDEYGPSYESFFSPYLNDNPRLIFPGTVDFSKSFNDVRKDVEEIATYSLNIYLTQNDFHIRESKYIHYFEKFDTPEMIKGKLTGFMSQFDAAIILYNKKKNRLRYMHSIPDRFFISLMAKLPICIKEGLLPSCEKIIKNNNNGIVYRDYDELNTIIRDKQKMNIFKENANLVYEKYVLDARKDDIKFFFNTLLD